MKKPNNPTVLLVVERKAQIGYTHVLNNWGCLVATAEHSEELADMLVSDNDYDFWMCDDSTAENVLDIWHEQGMPVPLVFLTEQPRANRDSGCFCVNAGLTEGPRKRENFFEAIATWRNIVRTSLWYKPSM